MSDIKEKDITTTVGGEESLLVKEAEKLTDTELTYETDENKSSKEVTNHFISHSEDFL